ncbi:MAG: hypothetical protein JSU86_12150 [Phycisphaerales bacterium]|nr:MAG: hypothetical protein JSU86_12150 [Phycisphaerales bacterium]
MAADENDSKPTGPSRGQSPIVPILVIALLMVTEGVGVYLLTRNVSPGPAAAFASRPGDGGQNFGDAYGETTAEVELVECRPTNVLAGKLITFHIRVSALVASADLQRAERLTRDKRARLEDGVNTVIRSAELRHFNEPKLTTIKRRLKHEFDRIFGDDQLIQEVLIPHFLQSQVGV